MDNEILGDVRVGDFTPIVSRPHCTRLLADLGAALIKFEPPEGEFWDKPMIASRVCTRNGFFATIAAGREAAMFELDEAEDQEHAHWRTSKWVKFSRLA